MQITELLAKLAKEQGLTPEQSQMALVWQTPTEVIVVFVADEPQLQEMLRAGKTGSVH